MKSYTITVNGNVYDVTVEENVGGAAPAAPVRKAAPVAAPKAAPAAPKAAGAAGGIKVTAGAAGKVFKIEASVGQKVSKGDVLAYIHSNNEEKIEKAKKDILNNITISDSYDLNIPVVYEIIR